MENNNKYRNGDRVYYYDSFGEMQYGQIYSMREYRGTADVMRSNQMYHRSEVELKKLWPTEKDCIAAKRDELMESVTDMKDLVDLMLKHGKWEGIGEVVKDVAERKMEDLDRTGYKVYAGDVPLTVEIMDPKRADTAYNLLCAMVENGTGFSYKGEPLELDSASDIRVEGPGREPYEPVLGDEWLGGYREGAGDVLHVCGWDEDGIPVQLSPSAQDPVKVQEMYNCLMYAIDPSVAVYAEGEVLVDLGNLNIMDVDNSYTADEVEDPDWANAMSDDFTDAVESLQDKGMEL